MSLRDLADILTKEVLEQPVTPKSIGGILIQARMGSTRFPGKVLAPLGGKGSLNPAAPMLGYLLERMALTGLPVAVSMPYAESVMPLAEYVHSLDWLCWGHAPEGISEDDVAGRLLATAQEAGWGWFLRVCGDSPLLDPALVTLCVERMQKSRLSYDCVSNMPHGQQVQWFETSQFAFDYERWGAKQREHCGKLRTKVDHTAPRFTVDTVDDLHRMTRLVEAMDKPHTEFEWQDLVQLHQEVFG